MTDLEFYQLVFQYQQYLLNSMAEAYVWAGHWKSDTCKSKIVNNLAAWRTNTEVQKLFDISNLTRERALTIGFRMGGDDLLLFPLWYTLLLPYGTKVINRFTGQEMIYGPETDLENRFGYVSFGIIL